jgi:hypothetical protein
MTDEETRKAFEEWRRVGDEAGAGGGSMTEELKPSQATPHADLMAALLDPNVPKTEREHAAASEIESLRARIAELEKARKPLAVGYAIVNDVPPLVCYNVHDTIEQAWSAHIAEFGDDRVLNGGDRAVRVAVVRVRVEE